MSLDHDAVKAVAASIAEELKTRRIMPRRAEARIQDPATHPRRYVSLVVAANYLECDRKTLNIWLADRKLTFQWFGRRRKIAVTELVAFEARQKVERKAG